MFSLSEDQNFCVSTFLRKISFVRLCGFRYSPEDKPHPIYCAGALATTLAHNSSLDVSTNTSVSNASQPLSFTLIVFYTVHILNDPKLDESRNEPFKHRPTMMRKMRHH